MKNNKFKKGLSLFLTVLMLMSCWVFIPGEHNHASAALGNVESHQGEVTGYVTVDPVIYIHGDNSSGDQYDYMNYGSVVSDGSYNGEYKTAVSVSGKTISSVTVTDTGATLGISGGVLTGNMSGGYGGETLFSTNSTATLKFTFTDGTFEYHKLAVKPNPVDQHAIALALNSNSSRRRMVSFEVLAKGSAGQNSGGSSNGNSSWIYRYNFPSMYQPFNTSYITDNQSSNPLIGGITSSQISADKVAGYAGSQRVSGSGDSVSITVTSPTAHYYLDLSSNKNLGVNLNGSNWSIDMLVGNLAMSSNYYGTGIGYKSHSLSNSSHTFAYSNTAGDLASSEAFSSGARAEGIVTIGGTQTTAGEISGNLSLTYDHGGSSSYHATATVVMPYYIVVVNKAALRNRYNEIVAQKLQSGNYTQTSWENFKSALLQAEVYLNNSTSGTSDEATLLSNLNTAYSNLKKRNFDINYDNLFSFSEWAASDCTNANATDRGSITYDIAKGTITAVDNSSNTSSNDLFTKYGLGSNLYTVPVKENTEYYLDFDVSATGGQCYIFYYSDSAAVNGSDGNPHTSLGAASGAKKFTTPAGCTKLGIRFGTAANGASVTFSNIRVYEADKKALIDAYKANGVPARTAYNYGDALNAGVVATPLRPGYKFEGWMIESDYSVLFNEDTLLSDFYGGYNFSASWIVYSNWNDILNDVNYDNLFSFSDWARSSSSTLNYATRAKISIDGENGSVTVTDISTVDGGGTYVDGNGVTQDYKDIYTKYSAAAGYYTIPVEGGTAYQFKYNISALSGQGQFFAFYYKYVNGAYQPAYNAGSTSNHWKGSYPTKTGEQIFEFTTPSDATHIQIRLGTSTDGASATYKDIRLYKSSDADKVASITYPNSQREYAASDYQTPTRSGYTFGGWYTDADYTTKATVNDLANSVTVYSKWTSNKYRVLFDNLLDIAKWTPSGSNATVEKTASGKGVKLVSNAGAGEGTCETAAFPVEAGKKYQVDIDFTGDNWDVYIFFRNETTGGTGIEFSDGATRRFSSNEGTGVKADSAIFTAPTGATKAVLRLDANGANNTVTFDNIRIFEVGKGEYGVSAELGQDVTFGSAYGSLPTPTRTGYTFAGWVNADGNAETATSVVDYAGTEILYSTWTVNKYTVKFVNAAGVTVSTATYDYGTAASDVKKAINTTANYDSTNHYSYSWPTINNVTGDVTYTEIKTTTAHTISSKITTAAACTTAGVRTYTCSGCAYSYTESIAATGHTFGATTAAKAATCLAAGNEAYKQCTVCDKYFAGDAATNATEGKADTSSFVIAQKAHSYTGAVKSDGNGKTATHSFKCVNGCNNYGGAVTHTWNSGSVTTAATCLTGGTNTYTCTVSGCGATYTETISATGHTFGTTTAAKAATCLATGNEAYKQCTVCNKYFADDAETNSTDGKADTSTFVIAQKSHSYTGAVKSDGNGKTATHSFKCVNGCNNYGGAVTHTWNSGSVTTAATCTTAGVKTYTCTASGCGATYTETISATGHTFGVTTAAKAATCLAAGNEAYKQCAVCDKYFSGDAATNSTEGKADTSSFVIAQKAHSYTGAVKSDGNGKTATHSFKCVNGCNNYGGAVTHTWNSGSVTTAATCLTGGTNTYTCTVSGCGATYTETISATGHTFGTTTAAKAATCLAAGNEAYKQCTVCSKYFADDAETNSTDGKADTSTFVIAQKSHSYTGAVKSDGNGKTATHSFKCVNGCNNYGAAVEHTWGEGVEDPESDCENTGIMTYTCTVNGCGATYEETTNSKGHTLGEWIEEVPAICNKTGVKGHYECSVCHKYFESDKTTVIVDLTIVIDPDNHNWIKGATVAPTCTDQGYTNYKCSYCDSEVAKDLVDALNHDYGTATYTWADDNSSCTATRVCSRDESHTETATATVTSAVKTPATCTAKGTTTYTAEFEADWTKEQTKDVEDIAALNHEYGEVTYKWSDDNSTCTATRVCNRDAKHTETATATVTSEITTPATCTAMGTTNYTAEFAESWAETQSKDVENIAALTHNWSTWSEVTAATCLDEGEEKRTCQREGCDAFETQAIEKLAHSYTGDYGWDSSAKTHTQKCVNGCNEYGNETACTFDEVVTDPTCYVNGYTTYTCKVCKNGYQANFTTRTHVYAYAKGDGTSHNVTCEYDNCDYTAAENCSGGTAYCNALAVCENCNTEWGSYNADNHTSTETYLKDEKTGNCGVEGYTGDTYHKCCDALKEKGKVISATGNHSYGGFDHDDGKSTHSKECSVCGNTVTENCTASDWITDVTATCMEKGSKYKECTVCTYEMEREEIPTTDHNFGGDAVNKGDGKHYYQCQNTLNTGKQCAEYGNEESCSGGTATCTDKAECEKCGTEYGTSLGHNYVGVVTKDPTCTEKGVKTYTCQNDASHTYEEEVAANGHTLTEVDAKAPTCEETGWEAYEYCSVCDYTTYEEIEATDHDYVGVVTKDPTCTEKGVKTYTCKNDASHTYEEEIAANGHTLTKVDAKAPTCEDIGWEAYEYCSVCDYTTYEEIKATDHDYVGVVTKDPTCTEKGIKTYTCKNDVNHTYEEDIAANGHTLTSVDAKAPTCEDIGWEAYEYCTVCTYTTYKETAALTHDYVDITYKWSDDNSVCTATRVCSRDESHTETATAEVTSVVKTPATCTEKGTTTYTATFTESWAAVQNKDVKDIAVDSSNHAGGTYINDEDIEEGTCISEKTWNEVTYCSGCKVKLSIVAKTGEKDENNHVDLKQVDAKAATCEEIGWSAYEYCSKCTYTTYVEIPKLGHDYDETKSEDNLKRPELVDGTWTKGYYTYTCKNNPLHTKKEEVDRASYTAYEAAWNNLESLLSTDITDAAKTAINTVLTDNDIAENLIASEQSTVDTAEANLKAAFEQYKGSLKTYKVTFKIDGSSDVVVEVISGNDALAPQNPTKNYDETYHYEFTGWNKEFTNITSDLTVTAEFDAVEHSFNTHTDKNDTYHTDKCACGYEKDVEHSYTSEVTKKASCDADGVRTYTCSVCNGTKAETITKRTHNIVDTTVALEPTCSATGIMNQKCDNAEDDEYEACGYTTTRVMDKVETAHKWETEYTVDVKASCEANGSKSYHCEYCDEINADSVVAIEKRDHVYKDNGVVTAATCLAAGTMNTICTNAETETHKACTHESTREIPQLSHSYTGGKYTWDETKKTHKELCVNGCNEYGDETECTFDAVVTKATCYAEGYTTHTCTVCNNSYKDTYTSRKHIYKYAAGNGTEHVVTCEYEDCAFEVTENCSGGTAYCNAKAICEKCNTRYGSVDEDNHTNLVKTNYKAATCTENGNKEYWTCEGCNKLYSDEKAKTETNAADVVIAALSHDWKATTYIWAENGSSCTATRECGRDADHTQTLKATITAEITTPATCTEKGTRTYTATFTEDWAETQNKALVDVVAPGHAFDETVEAKDATCIATGNEEYKQCTVCKKYFAEDAEANSTDGKADISSFVIEIDSDNHVNKTEYGKQDSTCTKPGYVAGVYCEDCGEWISGREEIEAKGHNFSEWKSNGDGTHTRTCTACTDEEDRIETEDCSGGTAYCNAKAICEKCNTGYGAKDPSNHSGQADVVKGYVPATCLEEGYSGDIHWSCCDVIYKVGKILPVNAANHTWESDGEEENWIVIKEATCTEEGIKICYCALSKDHYKQVKIPKKDHEYKATVVAPTCVNSGYTNHKCTECNTSYDDTYIDVLGHNHVSVVTPPTCEEDGYTTYTCSRCDDSYVDDYVAANHPDKDGDGNCDNCEGDRVAMCTCLCHSRNWFMKIIYKILNFIWKLFKVNAVCGCGNTHY